MRCAFVFLKLALAAVPAFALAAPGGAPVDRRLGALIEAAVANSHLATINIVSSDVTSLEIDKINGISVCSGDAKALVLALQDALEVEADLYQTYSIFRITVRMKNGDLVHSTYESMKERGILTSDCINLYVSVRPPSPPN